MKRKLLLACSLALAGANLAPGPASGQTPEEIVRQELGQLPPGTNLRVYLQQRLATTGLTEAELRQRLAAAGYDPSILDAYLGPDTGQLAPAPGMDVIRALEALGVPRDTLAVVGILGPVAAPARTVEAPPQDTVGLEIFGLDVFRQPTSAFAPVISGPVPPDYVLGPGDEIVLIITGDVEKAHVLPVTREGFIVIPEVGQVWVNGLTMAQLREQLFTYLGRAYSGIGRGPEATTHFQVSLGQMRSSQVYVTGEVREPGAYVVSPLASVLAALYQAGGPSESGSLREVRIVRNGQTVHLLDLYEYLLEGNDLSQYRLQSGDVVFVPVHGERVAIEGEVVRPAIFELRAGETLLDLLEFAGGLTAPASLRRARITRIVPPGQRVEPGVGRTVIDVDLAEAVMAPGAAPELEPGDRVRIFPIRMEERNIVSIEGGVWAQGTYEFSPGMSAWDLIAMADGLRPDAYRERAQIIRMDPADSSLAVLDLSLDTAPDGTPLEDPELHEFDVLNVFSRTEFEDDFTVRIAGEVRDPGTLPFRDGMTLADLLLAAGGLRPSADLTVEVARLAHQGARENGTIANVISVPVDSGFIVSERGIRFYPGEGNGVSDDGTAAAFELRPYDQVYVRRLPEFEPPRTVELGGEVRYPGDYALMRKDERLSSLIQRAGGL
ncbi:MAG: SLBB domain-containing protein, partial [Longimicrobiales bacterium]